MRRMVRRRTTSSYGAAASAPTTEQLYSLLAVRIAMATAALESDLTTKARIRDAAMELFAREGAAAGSLRAVARAAAVSPGLIVHHFGSTEGVIRADSDPFWRATHQIILVAGTLMLRPLIERELGGDLLAEDNVSRWTEACSDLLRHGLYMQAAGKDGVDARRG